MIVLAARLLGWWASLAPPGYCAGFPPGVSVRQERICGMDLAWQQLAAKLFMAALVSGFLAGLLFAWAWGIGRLWGGTLADRTRARYRRWSQLRKERWAESQGEKAMLLSFDKLNGRKPMEPGDVIYEFRKGLTQENQAGVPNEAHGHTK